VEPFVGSGALFLNAGYSTNLIADSNRDLMQVYTELKAQPLAFIRACHELFSASNNDETVYNRFREEFNASNDLARKAVLFVYLNRHCFNGLCRYNGEGTFNVPVGRFAHPYFPEQEMLCFAEKLQTAVSECQDFRITFDQVGAGDVVYCDPPYVPLTRTASFTSYAKENFSERDQRDLAELALRSAAKGAFVMISNHDTDITRQLYSGAAQILPLLVARTISCKGDDRKPAKELLAIFTNPLNSSAGRGPFPADDNAGKQHYPSHPGL
jgi:DNA adenine methylase